MLAVRARALIQGRLAPSTEDVLALAGPSSSTAWRSASPPAPTGLQLDALISRLAKRRRKIDDAGQTRPSRQPACAMKRNRRRALSCAAGRGRAHRRQRRPWRPWPRRAGTGRNLLGIPPPPPEDGARRGRLAPLRAGRSSVRARSGMGSGQRGLLWRDGSPGMQLGSAGLPSKGPRGGVPDGGRQPAGARRRTDRRAGRDRARPAARPGLEQVAAPWRWSGRGPAVEAPDLPRHARVVLASDFLDPIETWAARLEPLRSDQARGACCASSTRAEEDFPFEGRTRFDAASGGGDGCCLARRKTPATAYREACGPPWRSAATLARRVWLALITHRTDRPAASAVLALYQALSERGVHDQRSVRSPSPRPGRWRP
jgi:hypothetical protein